MSRYEEEERRRSEQYSYNGKLESNYLNDELVETLHPDRPGWHLGAVYGFDSYIVKNDENEIIDNGIVELRHPITEEYTFINGLTAKFKPGDDVEFYNETLQEHEHGILLGKKYKVEYYSSLRPILTTSSEMRRPPHNRNRSSYSPSGELLHPARSGLIKDKYINLAEGSIVRQQVEPIKTIEVTEDFVINDTIGLETKKVGECHEEDGIVFVLETNEKEYKSECVSIAYIKSINRRRPSDLGSRYMIIEIEGGLYNIKKPNWVKNINSLTIDDVPEPRTFYLEKEEVLRGVQPYKLVKLNIVVKPQEQAVAEEHIKPELEKNTNKRTRKRGGKRLKKRIKTNKRGKSKKVRR